ncbi:hypothetical protein CRYO30217_01112 [Parvicella tangerina]|uniref:Uncharacterized protein n=2 Tax=Parvicella tangerina TaxID=2829795 RepID=A0A916JLU0_9FLAO|nr:hypothetical protein CRYO30217_01112 [Parvicella tangerina]
MLSDNEIRSIKGKLTSIQTLLEGKIDDLDNELLGTKYNMLKDLLDLPVKTLEDIKLTQDNINRRIRRFGE